MIGSLIALIILFVIIGFVWYAVQRLLALIHIAEPFTTIIHLLMMFLVLIVVIYAITIVLGMVGTHIPLAIGR